MIPFDKVPTGSCADPECVDVRTHSEEHPVDPVPVPVPVDLRDAVGR